MRQQYRFASLLVICAQTTALVLLTRYSRVVVADTAYLSSTVILLSELSKLAITLLMILMENGGGVSASYYSIGSHLSKLQLDCLLLIVPSFLYTIQNNIIFYALSNLTAATFQVTYQLKILVTAVLSWILLAKRLTSQQWFALVILVVGVVMVQLNGHRSGQADARSNSVRGLLAVLLACLSSGFAGVFFEKIVKSDIKHSLSMRNLQLSLFSVPLASAAVYVNDADAVMRLGFFYGYNWLTLVIVVLHAVGGIAVSVAVKYADNVLKGFATSVSIVLSTGISCMVEETGLTTLFITGSVMVVASSLIYGWTSPNRHRLTINENLTK